MSRTRISPEETERVHRSNTIAFITSLKWPCWPLLPMKKDVPGNWPEIGFLYADYASDKDGVKLYHASFMDFGEMTPEQRKEVKVTEFATVGALLDAGWRID